MADPHVVDDMLTIEKATREFGINRATLYRFVQSGRLTIYRREMDRHVYVRRSEIESLRRFRPVERSASLNRAFIDEAEAFQRRVFGDRILSTTAAELIEEARRERTDELP
jgi:hypothetical protein